MRLAAAIALVLTLVVGVAYRSTNRQTTTTPAPPTPHPSPSRSADGRINPELLASVEQLDAQESAADRDVWPLEMLAQAHTKVLDDFWDSLLRSNHRLELARSLDANSWILPSWTAAPARLPLGILKYLPEPAPPAAGSEHWRARIDALVRDGWELDRIELRHTRFLPPTDHAPASSMVYFSAHLRRDQPQESALAEGDLHIAWATNAGSATPSTPRIEAIDASRLSLKRRSGPPGFEPMFTESIEPPRNALSVDPILVHDLDLDGFPEIIVAGRNLVYRRQAVDGTYHGGRLCRSSPGLISSAVAGDFDGDGQTDLLFLQLEGAFLYRGSGGGRFDAEPRRVWSGTPDLKYPMVMTTGDVDVDGDLDVFIGQYRIPYEDGSLPTPFHDANDGTPAYLLLNDGHGGLVDATPGSGLEGKRYRRTYSASLVDLNSDRLPDLVVVSDFAGIDIHLNEGRGHYRDVTHAWLPETLAFGMAHALADFDRDGRLDIFMAGMTSPTVDRLEGLGIERGVPQGDAHGRFRRRLAAGNRLYLSNRVGGFDEAATRTGVARSGWSWGCSAFDVNNDGHVDLYVGNGLESRNTVRDYESEYWLHDRFIATSEPNPAAYLYFKGKFGRTRGQGMSYGGFEKNRLFLNLGGAQFEEIAHLIGVGFEWDARNVVSADLDADGRMDLILLGYDAWPNPRPSLRLLRNVLPTTGHWIGFHLPTGIPQGAEPGMTISIRIGDETLVRQWVTGDSYRSQHPPSLHFGLGSRSRIDSAEIRWPRSATRILRNPAINRYHRISPEAEAPSAGAPGTRPDSKK